jgi:tyrosinase
MINEIIPKYPPSDRDGFRRAAATWRLPYWDWAAKKKRGTKITYDVPLIVQQETIEIINYDLGSANVENPMYRFTMPGKERMGCAGVSDIQDETSEGENSVIPVSRILLELIGSS